MKYPISLLLAGACVALTVVAYGQVGTYSRGILESLQTRKPQPRVNNVIKAEEPDLSNAQELEVRRSKNERYNTGGTDLTQRPQNEIFIEQYWPAVDFIPSAASALVVVGRVVKVQPYLSSDRSRIYTEITIATDNLLKVDRCSRVSANKTVVIDRLGGVVKLPTGRIVRDDIQIDNLGIPRFGRRYVFFAGAVNDGNDVSLIKSYELLKRKVFTNDSRPSRLITTLPGVPSKWSDETAFLGAVHEVTVSAASN